MDFSSRQLRAFLLVAQHHSFTRAAESLFITPSGLSVLIRELETQLGFRLFDRTTRHVELTSYGRELLVATRRNLEELDAAMSRIGQTAKDAGQSLSVGAPALVSANVLPQAIKEFRTQCPTARIQLFDSDLTTLLQRVQAGKLDMALGTFGNAPGVRRIPFFRFSLMLIGPDKEPSILRASATWSTLNGKKLISLRAASPIQQLIDKYLAQADVVPKAVMVLNALDTQIAMVEAGEGIAVIPSFGLPACRNRKVVMIRLINPVVTLDFHQIRNRGRKLPPAAEEFTSFLKSYIARWAGRAGVL
jgi:LysR family carnitine catabolism transcriptional activator